uniref:Uncharacterized protein n=1 Tax=Arundo donax TaxID=35708 RepID=A0A0A9GFU4_ARUDO
MSDSPELQIAEHETVSKSPPTTTHDSEDLLITFPELQLDRTIIHCCLGHSHLHLHHQAGFLSEAALSSCGIHHSEPSDALRKLCPVSWLLHFHMIPSYLCQKSFH